MTEIKYEKYVTNLGGGWPEWFGEWGMRFIYIRIRHGECYVGIGNSHNDAFEHATLRHVSSELEGVVEIMDAVRLLERCGYKVKSIVIPEHVQELE